MMINCECLENIAFVNGGSIMRDPLEFLWPIAEAVHPIVTPDGLRRWPKEVREQMIAAMFLKPAGTAESIRCPACDRVHKGIPFDRKSATGKIRHFIRCPEVLRAEVTAEDMQQWTVDVGAIVRALAAAMSLSGTCKDLASDRVWRCGRTMWQGTLRDILFARGLARQDADQFRRAITACHRPIVLVGIESPPADFWRGRGHTVVALSPLAHFEDGEITLELDAIVAAVHEAEATANLGAAIANDKNQLSLVIRRQIKAESKTELSDDVLTTAYRHCGSTRSAASYLSQQTSRNVSKDQVHRAVQRAGGALAVLNSEDSNSVVRGVASQRRDKSGKPIRQSKPIEEE